MQLSSSGICIFNHSVVSNLFDPMDCNLLGSSVHGNTLARILEWVAISYSRGYFWSRTRSSSPTLAGGFFTTELPGKPHQVAEKDSKPAFDVRAQPVNHNVQDIGKSLSTEIHTSKLLGKVCLKFSKEKMILHIKGIESSQVLLEHKVRRLQKARRDAGEKLGNKVNDPFPATYKWDISFRNNQAALPMMIYVEWYLYNIYIKIWANVATLEQFRVKSIKKSMFPKWMNLALVPFLTISVLKIYIYHSHSAIRISFSLLRIMSRWAILL